MAADDVAEEELQAFARERRAVSLFRRAQPSSACFAGLGVFSKFYFSSTIISDSRTYGTIGAVFGILIWLVIAAVIILGAVAGVVWDGRSNGSRTR